MGQKTPLRLAGLVLATALVQSSAALALEPAAPSFDPAMGGQNAPYAASAAALHSSPVVGDAALDAFNGRGAPINVGVALTEHDLTAINTGNTINAAFVSSGAINLQDSALSGFQGLGNLMMNTGHNNNLQSSLSVTIVISGASPGG